MLPPYQGLLVHAEYLTCMYPRVSHPLWDGLVNHPSEPYPPQCFQPRDRTGEACLAVRQSFPSFPSPGQDLFRAQYLY